MAVQIITTSLPNAIDDVAYSQTISTYGGVAPLVFAVDSGSLPTGLSLNTSSGAITGTPTTPGTYTFTIGVTDDAATTDTQSYSVRVYAALDTSPDPAPGDSAVFAEAGEQVSFSVTGGSGSYQWSVTGGNLINPITGLLTAINGGSYVVTVTDTESGQTATVDIVITSQSQFCVEGAEVSSDTDTVGLGDVCCEFNVECGDRLQLRVPSFHIIENGVKIPVVYGNLVQATTGDASALQSTAAVGGASGNEVSFNRDVYFEIVTSFDMAATGNGDFGIGWSSTDVDATVASIDHAVVWFTDTAVRYVEIRHSSNPEAGSKFAISQGDVVSFGVIGGELQLWINSVLMYTSTEDFGACGNVVLDVGIEEALKTIGGYVTNLSWTIVTTGTAAEVGAIDANGIYTSPSNPLVGVVKVQGSINSANFFVNVRNIQPTPKFIQAQPFIAGRRAHIWVTNRKATDNEVIRIASDGSPDAIQNPGMIYLGVLEGSATFTEEIEYQNFDNDEGTYFTAVASEKATLKGMFMEVRDLPKLNLLMQHSTLYPESKGVKELGVGGKTSTACELRAVLIIEAGAPGSGWDVIYMPRVQNTANLNLEVGKKANGKYEINFRVLPDVTRAQGRQLYSIYQISNCGTGDTVGSCA